MSQYCKCPKGTDSRHPCVAKRKWCYCCHECMNKCLKDDFNDWSEMHRIIDSIEYDLNKIKQHCSGGVAE